MCGAFEGQGRAGEPGATTGDGAGHRGPAGGRGRWWWRVNQGPGTDPGRDECGGSARAGGEGFVVVADMRDPGAGHRRWCAARPNAGGRLDYVRVQRPPSNPVHEVGRDQHRGLQPAVRDQRGAAPGWSCTEGAKQMISEGHGPGAICCVSLDLGARGARPYQTAYCGTKGRDQHAGQGRSAATWARQRASG